MVEVESLVWLSRFVNPTKKITNLRFQRTPNYTSPTLQRPQKPSPSSQPTTPTRPLLHKLVYSNILQAPGGCRTGKRDCSHQNKHTKHTSPKTLTRSAQPSKVRRLQASLHGSAGLYSLHSLRQDLYFHYHYLLSLHLVCGE